MTEALESPADPAAASPEERLRQLERQVEVLRALLDQEREQRRRELVRGAEELDLLRDQRRADAATIRRLRAVERRYAGAGQTSRARLRRALRRRAPESAVRVVRALRRGLS